MVSLVAPTVSMVQDWCNNKIGVFACSLPSAWLPSPMVPASIWALLYLYNQRRRECAIRRREPLMISHFIWESCTITFIWEEIACMLLVTSAGYPSTAVGHTVDLRRNSWALSCLHDFVGLCMRMIIWGYDIYFHDQCRSMRYFDHRNFAGINSAGL